MEGFEGLGFGNTSNTVRRRRSNTSRRPWNDPQSLLEFYEGSSLSSTPPSENNTDKAEEGVFIEPDEGLSNGSFRGYNEAKHNEGFIASTNAKSQSSLCDRGVASNENTVKRVKLKVNGVTRTIDAKVMSNSVSSMGSSSTKSLHLSNAPWLKQTVEESSEEHRSTTSDKNSRFRGLPWRGFQGSSLRIGQADNKVPVEQTENKYQPLRKSKRILKRRFIDKEPIERYDDDSQIQYLEEVNAAKVTAIAGVESDNDDGGFRKHRKLSKVMKQKFDGLCDSSCSSRSSKKGRNGESGQVKEDTDYFEEDQDEEEPFSDCELANNKRKKASKHLDFLSETKGEMTVTTRRRALQSGKDFSSGHGPNLVELPQGLPPAPPRRQKERLSEVEQQLKKAEAAQRRRMQVEKAARDSEAEAIRKILGQDSSRKKREDKVKKRQEEYAKERAANAVVIQSGTVRWVRGPSGTVVTFPVEVGLPNIFNTKPCSYPPLRERCAGPSCTNPYKYRDSKSKLPLCSLQCYKALQGKPSSRSAC